MHYGTQGSGGTHNLALFGCTHVHHRLQITTAQPLSGGQHLESRWLKTGDLNPDHVSWTAAPLRYLCYADYCQIRSCLTYKGLATFPGGVRRWLPRHRFSVNVHAQKELLLWSRYIAWWKMHHQRRATLLFLSCCGLILFIIIVTADKVV